MLSRRTMRGPSTGVFQMAVWTVLPCHVMSRGRPTLTESKRSIIYFPYDAGGHFIGIGTVAGFKYHTSLSIPVGTVWPALGHLVRIPVRSAKNVGNAAEFSIYVVEKGKPLVDNGHRDSEKP